jgi:tumor protein p53-inducible protein 3
MEGRWVIYGTLGGTKLENADLGKILGMRLQILGTTLRSRSDAYKS